jgi:hypothetical protein
MSRLVRKPHWLLCSIATELDYFPTVEARLGNGMRMRVHWGQVVGTGILVNGFHEPHTTRVVQQLLITAMTFFDVGAHVGQYTLLAAGLVGREGHVHSFEPDARSFRLLDHNVSINRLDNVKLNNCAVTSDRGTGPSASRRSLDDYVTERAIEHVDLIKIDIDGGELDVLHGSRQVLSRLRPTLIVEFAEDMQAAYGHSCAELADFLHGLQYELYCIDTDRVIPYAPWGPERAYFNVLAIPSEMGSDSQYRCVR